MDRALHPADDRAVVPTASSPAVSPVPASIPSAEIGRRCADSISPDLFLPLVKRVVDDIYERLLNTVQDYLVENSEFNIAERIESHVRESQRLRAELAEVDKALGWQSWMGTRADAIGKMDHSYAQYQDLLYQVGSKYEGETRHETAKRYIREREAQGPSAFGQDAKQLEAKPAGPVLAENAPELPSLSPSNNNPNTGE